MLADRHQDRIRGEPLGLAGSGVTVPSGFIVDLLDDDAVGAEGLDRAQPFDLDAFGEGFFRLVG